MPTNNNSSSDGWIGWTIFASFMMMLIGGMQAIVGLAGIFKNSFYVVTQSHLLVFDYKAWGWMSLIIGVVIFLAGFALLKGATWARILAVFIAGLSFLGNMAFINAYPIWSILIMVVDVMVIYSIVVHGGELKEN